MIIIADFEINMPLNMIRYEYNDVIIIMDSFLK